MKKLGLTMGSLLIVATTLTSCREEKEKEVIVKELEVERKAEPEEEREGILERTAKEVDKEVNEEIDKKIEEIGDDN